MRLNPEEKAALEKRIIENYQTDERMMVLVFSQWCINHDLDPQALYKKAYPNQPVNPLLEEVEELTVPKKESEDIATETVLQILQVFGNDDLAFIVQEESDRNK
jgi:hypothetical protein